MTEVIAIDALGTQGDRIARAAACLRAGGLVAFPTETVYGLGANALDRDAVRRLFTAKGRPANDPLIVHVASLESARPLVTVIPAVAVTLAARFWPGPLTMIMRRSPAVPDEVTAGLDTVAVRVPAHPVARALIEAAGIPVAAPSANLFSRPSPTAAAHVLEDLRDRIDMVVDGGTTSVGVESTVLDLSTNPPVVLRPGAITLEMIHDVLPTAIARVAAVADASAQRSPGMLSKHYAPRTPLTLYRGEASAVERRLVADAVRMTAEGIRTIVLAPAETAGLVRHALSSGPGRVIDVGMASDLATVSRRLYAALREADAAGADVILMPDLDTTPGLATAIRDRLQRAAARIVQL